MKRSKNWIYQKKIPTGHLIRLTKEEFLEVYYYIFANRTRGYMFLNVSASNRKMYKYITVIKRNSNGILVGKRAIKGKK